MSGDSNVQGELFSPLEIDTIGEIMNISMGSAATAASTLLDNKVTITTPVVKILPVEEFEIAELEPAVAVEIQYVEGISGSNIMILRKTDIRIILGLMMMTEMPEEFVVDEMAESAICELMNQMMGSSATVLSCFLGRTINISTPRIVSVEELDDFKKRYFGADSSVVSIGFSLIIKDTVESQFVCAMKMDLAKEIIDVSLNFDTDPAEDAVEEQPSAMPPAPVQNEQASPMPPAPKQMEQPHQAPPVQAPIPQAPPVQPPPAAPQPEPQYPQPYPIPEAQPQYQQPYSVPQYAAPPPPGYGYPPPAYPQPQYAPPQQPAYDPVMVKDYNFGEFGQGGHGGKEAPLNMDLVMNVPVVMTVELGRTRRKIKEILEFGQGTIVQLDKQAGSQVDVIVNGQLIARGDVVVVDDNFSIRITEIIKNKDPLSMI